MKRPTPLKKIINTASAKLRHLTGSIHQLRQLNARLAQILPAATCQHCQITSISNQNLIICCDSAAWATRIRFEQSKIIKAFRDQNVSSVGTRIHTPPSSRAASTAPDKPREISKDTANLLNQLAKESTNDKLKSALRRLANHSKLK